jgi:DNA polymerase type B, organellar and viral
MHKTCRKCSGELTEDNWPPSRRARQDYICNTCRGRDNAPYRREARTSRKYKGSDEYEFRGVDGEGGNVPEPGTLFGTRHQYLSLRAGPDLLETGEPLSWEECLSFLSDLPARFIYVAYFFDYDVTMIIRTFPEERARRLLNRHLRSNRYGTLPVEIGDFEVDYLQHKEFKVRRKGARHWTIINDVGQFFQSSFLNTLIKWEIGTPDELEVIRKGKLMRSEFAEHSEEIEYYNTLECLKLEELMTHFRSVCWETGYVPKKWQGPGHLASAMLSRHGVPKRDDIPIMRNDHFRKLAQEAYYGGRFETTAAGPVHGPVIQYDINGAYVAALRTLPCLIHGSWRETKVRPEPGNLWFGRIKFRHNEPTYLYNLPIRAKNGNIYYPREGSGVYWSVEAEEAERVNTNISFTVGWVYEPHCECRWFDFVDSYYLERLRLGKTAKGYVLKLAGNSVYGKLAQSIGYAPWANPVWAGLITATCRAQIINAYSQDPWGTYMIATDGIFCSKELNLPVSRDLGDWERTVHDDGIFIVQPGIYFSGAEPKSRGIERGKVDGLRPLFEETWRKFQESHGLDHTVSVPVTNFITAKQAIARSKWEIAGTWETVDREISFSWATKRISGLARSEDDILRTFPQRGAPDLESVGYSRLIGGGLVVDDAERYDDPSLRELARLDSQPDEVRMMDPLVDIES